MFDSPPVPTGSAPTAASCKAPEKRRKPRKPGKTTVGIRLSSDETREILRALGYARLVDALRGLAFGDWRPVFLAKQQKKPKITRTPTSVSVLPSVEQAVRDIFSNLGYRSISRALIGLTLHEWRCVARHEE